MAEYVYHRISGLRNSVRRVVSCLVLCIIHSGCSDDVQVAQTVDTSGIELDASNTVWNTEIVFTDSVTTKATVHADRARIYASRQETLLDSNVVVYFFDKDGTQAAQLHCRKARVDNRTNTMYATGSVVIESALSSTRVESNSMMWNGNTRKLSSPEYVKVNRPGEVLEGGVGFESDESMSNYRIFKVRGVKQ
jgi:LPS export ABC transporter protein LptC